MRSTSYYLLWKLFFWLYAASIILAYRSHEYWRIYETIDVMMTAIALFGLFLFAWQKYNRSHNLWRLFLPLLILWNGLYLFVIPLPVEVLEKYPLSQFALAFPFFIYALPLFYGLYLYAFSQTKKRVESPIDGGVYVNRD